MGIRLRALLPVAVVIAGVAGSGLASAAGSHPAARLYVTPHGNDQGSCTRPHPCRTIGHAVALARPGDEVEVAAGIYPEQVTLTKRLTLTGSHAPEIDAHGRSRGVLIKGPSAAGSIVRGFIVQDATYEGILALQTRRVTISGNVVRHDDRGFFEKKYVGECAANGVPGGHVADARAGGWGEAIHLASTSDSQVLGNLVTGNTGGIYLTDESAPAAHNLLAHNVVEENQFDCGITLASHSHRAVSRSGRLRPRAGGVYDNTITHNVANLNGLRVPGAGILVAAAFVGSAAYGNRIIANTTNDNGLPGIALHSHTVGQNLNGNVIRNNVVGRNALGGRHGGPGDGDGGVTHTCGILVWSDVTKLTGTRIAGNRLHYDYFGIWTKHVPRVRRRANRYHHVRVPLRQYS